MFNDKSLLISKTKTLCWKCLLIFKKNPVANSLLKMFDNDLLIPRPLVHLTSSDMTPHSSERNFLIAKYHTSNWLGMNLHSSEIRLELIWKRHPDWRISYNIRISYIQFLGYQNIQTSETSWIPGILEKSHKQF